MSVNSRGSRSCSLRSKQSEPINLKRAKLISEAKFPAQFFGLFNVKFSPDGNDVLTCFGQGAIQVRSPENGNLKRTIRSGGNYSYPIQCARFNPLHISKCYAASTCGNIFLCDVLQFDYTTFATEYKNEVNSIDITCDGSNAITGGKDTFTRVYDTTTCKLKNVYGKEKGKVRSSFDEKQKWHFMRIYCVKSHPRFSDVFLTGGWDDIVLIWDLRDPDGCVRSIKGPHICGESIDIRDKIVLTGSWSVRESIKLWDFGSGKLITPIMPFNRPYCLNGEFVYTCQFFDGDASDDQIVSGGSGAGYVEVISIKQNQVLTFLKTNKPCQTLDSYKDKIIYGGMEPCFRIIDYSSGSRCS